MTTLAMVKKEINSNMATLVKKNIAPSTKKALNAYTKAIKANGAIVKRYSDDLTDKERGELYRHMVKLQNTTGMLMGLWDANGDDIEITDKKPVKMPLKAILATNLILAVLILAGLLLTPVKAQESTKTAINTYGQEYLPMVGEEINGTYSTLLKVKAVQHATGESCAIMVNSGGFEYHMDILDEDVLGGEYYTAIMYNNGTQDISDDIIMSVKYARADLLENLIDNPSSKYAKTMIVDAIEYNNGWYHICFIDCMGFTYEIYQEDGDIEVGDFYSCIMDRNGTNEVMDDIITDIKYERIDLLIKGYNDRHNNL